jgi:phage baseplate assembly protein W
MRIRYVVSAALVAVAVTVTPFQAQQPSTAEQVKTLVAEALEQCESRIRQGQGEVGVLPRAEQGKEAERPGELVVSVQLHEVLTIELG